MINQPTAWQINFPTSRLLTRSSMWVNRANRSGGWKTSHPDNWRITSDSLEVSLRARSRTRVDFYRQKRRRQPPSVSQSVVSVLQLRTSCSTFSLTLSRGFTDSLQQGPHECNFRVTETLQEFNFKKSGCQYNRGNMNLSQNPWTSHHLKQTAANIPNTSPHKTQKQDFDPVLWTENHNFIVR